MEDNGGEVRPCCSSKRLFANSGPHDSPYDCSINAVCCASAGTWSSERRSETDQRVHVQAPAQSVVARRVSAVDFVIIVMIAFLLFWKLPRYALQRLAAAKTRTQ